MADPEADQRASGLQSVRKVSPTHQVREQLLSAIKRGEFPAGSSLPSERALCETFGVSRVSVREAIAGLEAMGLIRVQHGRGAFVQRAVEERYSVPFSTYLQIHRNELLELLKVRGALDGLAAAEAALRGTPEGLSQMTRASDRFRKAVASDAPDYPKLAELDVAFHVSVSKCSGGNLLPSLLVELHSILEESRRMTLARGGQLDRSVQQHQAIVDAILAGDPEAARQAVDSHLIAIRTWVEEFRGPDDDENAAEE